MTDEICVRNKGLLVEMGFLLGGLPIIVYFGLALGWVTYMLLSRWLTRGFAVLGSRVLYIAVVLALAACTAALLVVVCAAAGLAIRILCAYVRIWSAKLACRDDEIALTTRAGTQSIHASDIVRLSAASGGARLDYSERGRHKRLQFPARAFRPEDFAVLRTQLERLAVITKRGAQ